MYKFIGLFLLWSIIPDETLHNLGIYYYPSKEWALSIPSLFCITFLSILIMY